MFKNKKISDHVVFLGHIPDIENFYASIDIAILTSKKRSIETTPNSLLEPMSMGKTVVSTNVGGIPEIVTDGSNGFIFDYGDIEGFTEKILNLISDKELSEKIGKTARERILTHHNENINIGHLAEIIKKAAG